MRVQNCSNDWKSWCRLCSKRNAGIDIFIKDENFYCLSEAIEKFLSISISSYDEAPTKICLSCHEILTGLISFSTQSAKVQEMYSELIVREKFEPITDLESLREKYGLKFSTSIFKLLNPVEEIESLEPKCLNANVDTSNKSGAEIEKHLRRRIFKIKESIYNQNKEKDLDPGNAEKHNFINENYQNKNILELESPTIELSEKVVKRDRNTMPKNFHCDHCVRTFATKKGLAFHVKTNHPIKGSTLKFPCSTCGRAFNNITTLKNHNNLHLPREIRRYYCPYCDEEFNSRGSVTPHVLRNHQKIKPFICEECGKGFYFKTHLLRHKVIHSEQRDFNCKKCSKKFKSVDVLRRHMDAHADTKYKCPICEALLNTKAILRKHMIVHSDVQKYKCNFCDKSFKRSKTLKGHLLMHSGLKPYQCPFCDLTFTHGSNCRKHQKQSHPIELAQMEESGEKKDCENIPKLETLKAANAAVMNARDAFHNSSSSIPDC